jgi:hypothetical protein
MKVTPKLIQLALGAIGIGAELEMCIKIHEVVKLLNEKGDQADLSDLAKIAAIQVESEKPQSEPLPSDDVDLSLSEVNDTVVFRDGKEKKISQISEPKVSNKYEIDLGFDDGSTAFYMNDGSFWVDKSYYLEDIVKIIKPN